MRKKLLGVIISAGLLVGVMAAPASAKGCPYIGESWSEWAQLGPTGPFSTGTWTGNVASSKTTDGLYPVADGPGVYARVIDYYCEVVAP